MPDGQLVASPGNAEDTDIGLALRDRQADEEPGLDLGLAAEAALDLGPCGGEEAAANRGGGDSCEAIAGGRSSGRGGGICNGGRNGSAVVAGRRFQPDLRDAKA